MYIDTYAYGIPFEVLIFFGNLKINFTAAVRFGFLLSEDCFVNFVKQIFQRVSLCFYTLSHMYTEGIYYFGPWVSLNQPTDCVRDLDKFVIFIYNFFLVNQSKIY